MRKHVYAVDWIPYAYLRVNCRLHGGVWDIYGAYNADSMAAYAISMAAYVSVSFLGQSFWLHMQCMCCTGSDDCNCSTWLQFCVQQVLDTVIAGLKATKCLHR